jgi:PAS domain S-box-containing protein
MVNLVNKFNAESTIRNLEDAIIIFDTDENIILLNDAAKLLFKIRSDDVIGEKMGKVFPELNYPFDNKNNLSSCYFIKDNTNIKAIYYPLIDYQGNVIGTIGIFKAEKDKDDCALEISDDIFNIFESFYDGIWITDSNGNVLYTNYANEKVSGFTKEQVVGKNINDLIKEEWFSNSVTVEVLKYKKRTTMMCYNYVTHKQVIVTGNPIFYKDGRLKYVCNNIRDITELINKKKELEENQKFIHRQNDELKLLRSLQFNNKDYIVNSDKMKKVFDLACRVAKFDSTVLILGESGCGKEGIAETIVKFSPRKDNPFIKVNCGAIPENLLESELFGYEKGAFTGANQKGKPGKFEIAQHGNILLDEIGDLPLNLQVKLLRIIQDKEVIRIGGNTPIPLDIRIIAATNKNLLDMVDKGTFREDLFYRLNVVTIEVPPLRERKSDISILLKYFLDKFNNKYSLHKTFSQEVIKILENYNWPGNVRELENFVESVLIVSQEDIITKEDLHPEFTKRGLKNSISPIQVNNLMPLREAQELLEKKLITKAMEKYGSTRKAAEFLQVDQSTIVRKMKKLNITMDEI